jgi:hypothetical protein
MVPRSLKARAPGFSGSRVSAQGTGAPDLEPGPAVQAFLAELARRWPAPTASGDESPWAFWPLWQPLGSGTVLNIAWPSAEEWPDRSSPPLTRVAWPFFDPQEGQAGQLTGSPARVASLEIYQAPGGPIPGTGVAIAPPELSAPTRASVSPNPLTRPPGHAA